MEQPDNRARWMRTRGVEIYTPETVHLLQDFRCAREYDMAVANVALANTSGMAVELVDLLPNALTNGILDYLERSGFDGTLWDISAENDEIETYTAARYDEFQDAATIKRTTNAAIHYVDSLLFGMRLPFVLASDAFLGTAHYDDMPSDLVLNRLTKILHNPSFKACLLHDFAKTGFSVLTDAFSVSQGVDGGASVRRSKLGLRKHQPLFLCDGESATFSVHPQAKAYLQSLYRKQNTGEPTPEIDRSITLGEFDRESKALTAGCPLRYKSALVDDIVGIEFATEFAGTFCKDVEAYFRLPAFTSPQLTELAVNALRIDAKVRLLRNYQL